jgi:hypothetical protein
MERHETMTINQAFLAVMQTVGTVKAGEVTAITTACTGSRLKPFSSIVAKQLLKVRVPTSEPLLHDLELGTLSLFGFLRVLSFSTSLSRVMLYIGLIFNIFGEGVVGFWEQFFQRRSSYH